MKKRYLILWATIVIGYLDCYGQDMVYLERCNTLSFDESVNRDAQILRGDVRFRHDSALMYCDSAYFYEKDNSLDAFGHVRMVQGDSLFGYADKMYYDGNKKIARFRQNVKLIHRSTTLTTDSLNYDRVAEIAYYYSGGHIVDSLNSLQSVLGTYYTQISTVEFYQDVLLEHPHFTLRSDTLIYNTETNIAQITTPTQITYSNETDIFSKNGWYNTKNEQSTLYDQSYIIHIDRRYLTGDTIFYDKQNKYGKIFGNMQMTDSSNHITLFGQYGEVYEVEERGFATKQAYVMDWSDSSNFAYLHADTIFTERLKVDSLFQGDSLETNLKTSPSTPKRLSDGFIQEDSLAISKRLSEDSSLTADSLIQKDSIAISITPNDSTLIADTLPRKQDSTYLLIRAYNRVRFFRNDLQGVCDSLVYNRKDSLIQLFTNPICWSDSSQLVADTITLFTDKKGIKRIVGQYHTFGIERLTTTYFNQVSGKQLYVHLDSNKVQNVKVIGNVETIYYPQDDDGGTVDYIGMNKLMCSSLTVFFDNKTVDHILFLNRPSATMYPLDQIPEEADRLVGFFWDTVQRPRVWQDIFKHPQQIDLIPKKRVRSASTVKTKEELEKEEKRNKMMNRRRNQRQ